MTPTITNPFDDDLSVYPKDTGSGPDAEPDSLVDTETADISRDIGDEDFVDLYVWDDDSVEPVDTDSDIPTAPTHKKKRKAYDTLNIPVDTFAELRRWRDALAAIDPDRKWTYEAVLTEMMEALHARNGKAAVKYDEMLSAKGRKRRPRKNSAKMRKSSLKKKKKDLGYIILDLGGNVPPLKMKIYEGKKVWPEGKPSRLPSYCHIPLGIPYDANYPFLKAGKNVAVKDLLSHPGAKREKGKSPVTVGQVKVWVDGEKKTLKIRRGQASNKGYVTMKRKRFSIDEMKETFPANRIEITYDDDKG